VTDEPWHCDGCPFRGCPECPAKGGGTVAAQADSAHFGYAWGSKTAPGVASTNTEGLTRSSGTSREGMAPMVATSRPARTPYREVSCAREV